MSLLADDRARPRLAIAGLACLVGFIGLALLVRAGLTTGIDTAGLELFRPLHGTFFDPIFVAISELGVADILAFFTMIPAGYLWVIGARRAAVYLVVGYIVAAFFSDGIKALLPLARPPVIYQIALKMPETEDLFWAILSVALVIVLWRTKWRWGAVIGGVLFAIAIFWDPTPLSSPGMDSFPSGHAFRSIVLACSVLFTLPYRPSRRLLGGLVVVVFLIGLSRVYLGEHHPSDVVAGWLAGFALIAALTLLPVFRSLIEAKRIEATSFEVPGGHVVTE